MVKDPWWLFAYWEIQPEKERAARAQLLPHEIPGLQSVLRVYEATEGDGRPFQDISLSGLATNWYLHTNAPGRTFFVELGLLSNTGRFLPMARSNRVTAPRFGPSDVIDEEWAVADEDFLKLLGAMGPSGASPMQWQAVSLPALFSGVWPGRSSIVRGFWCRVDTDLVIHGVTDPKASVRIQGQPVTVRKDGTFSLRLALPQGSQAITIEATSPDGRHTKTVTPLVSLSLSGPLSGEPAPRSQSASRAPGRS
jgi:hypothetical protein